LTGDSVSELSQDPGNGSHGSSDALPLDLGSVDIGCKEFFAKGWFYPMAFDRYPGGIPSHVNMAIGKALAT